MNDPELDALFAKARGNRPDTSRAEYGFETRLMARLRARDSGSIWAIASWRMIPFFAAVVMALGVWQAKLIVDTNDAVDSASVQNPTTFDLWNSLN